MKDAGSRKLQKLDAILDGDGDKLREQFIYAGLLLTIFERFKAYVIDRVDEFFASNMEIKDGTIKYMRGSKFKKLIKEQGNGDRGQHKNQVFRAALKWFQSLDAIDKSELDEVERLYSLRNEIGHELLLIISDDGKQPITIFDVILALSVYVKITRWWWKEIECATDPDMTQEKYDSIQWDEVETVDTIVLQAIFNKALEDNPLWQEIQRTTEAAQES